MNEQARIDRAVDRQKRTIGRMRARKAPKTGARKVMSIDSELFYNAVAVGREKYGVDNVFDEPEFVRDCERHHPWIKVPQDDNNTLCLARAGGGRPRNRFGKVKERISFEDGKKVVRRFCAEGEEGKILDSNGASPLGIGEEEVLDSNGASPLGSGEEDVLDSSGASPLGSGEEDVLDSSGASPLGSESGEVNDEA